jgi:hypothetical protein
MSPRVTRSFDRNAVPESPSQTPNTPRRTSSPLGSVDATSASPQPDIKIFYRMIGECYVHRMMNGEAIDYQSIQALPKVVFEIR